MNLRDLKYLVALVELEHFGKAADQCFVSQPTLSMQIKKLEETLGVSLLERKNRSFMLTEIGKVVAEKAREILYHVEVMKDLAHQSKDPYSGELRVGVIPTLAPYLLPYLVSGLIKLFPALKIYWIEKQTSELLQDLNQGQIDAALLALPIFETSLLTQPLFQEEFLLGVGLSHAWATRKIIKTEELNQEELLLLEEGHCLRDQALAICPQVKAVATRKFEATSLETLRHMVASGLGVTLIPKLASKGDDGLSYLTFSGTRPSRTFRMRSPRGVLSTHRRGCRFGWPREPTRPRALSEAAAA
jgi:LysR family hydrogen peroxide-inducible transcriptional activator